MSIADVFNKLISSKEMYCKICTVDDVDKDKRVCDVSPIDGSAPIFDVKIQANQDASDGISVIPVKGSYVVVGFTTDSTGVVLLTEKIESIDIKIGDTTVVIDKDGIVLNGGNNDGIVKINELTDKLNELKDTVDAMVKAYNTHVHVVTDSIGGNATVLVPAGPAQPPKPFSSKDYENNKIKH